MFKLLNLHSFSNLFHCYSLLPPHDHGWPTGGITVTPQYAFHGVICLSWSGAISASGNLGKEPAKKRAIERKARKPRRSKIALLVSKLPSKLKVLFSLVGIGGIIAVMSIAISLQADRAFISIGVIEFEPNVPVADKRMRIAIMLKNSGRNRATIESMATDRLGKLPPQPKYELANYLILGSSPSF
jgi:hypothetical protein